MKRTHKAVDPSTAALLHTLPTFSMAATAVTLLNTYRTHPFHGMQEYYYRVDAELDSPEFWLWISRVLASAPERLTIDSYYGSKHRYATVGYYSRGR